MNKKFNITFSGKISSYLLQVYLHPILLIAGAILIASLNSKFKIEFDYIIGMFVLYWTMLGFTFSHIKPFYCIATTNYENNTRVTVGYKNKKISGILEEVQINSSVIFFKVESKTGLKSLSVPATLLGEHVSKTLVDTINNIQSHDFIELEKAFNSIGISSNIKNGGDIFQNIKLGTQPSYITIRLWLSTISMIACYMVIF